MRAFHLAGAAIPDDRQPLLVKDFFKAFHALDGDAQEGRNGRKARSFLLFQRQFFRQFLARTLLLRLLTS